MEGDEGLNDLNEGELLWMARLQGLPPLRRELPREVLLSLVAGTLSLSKEHVAGTQYTRYRLEKFIQENYERVRGQLPGCNGRCQTYPCTEGKHMGCFVPTEPLL